MRLFADTGAWCALYDRSDTNHARASAFLQELRGQKAWLVTSDYILDETLTLLRFRAGHREAIEFGKWVLQSPLVKVVDGLQAASVRYRAISSEDCGVQ